MTLHTLALALTIALGIGCQPQATPAPLAPVPPNPPPTAETVKPDTNAVTIGEIFSMKSELMGEERPYLVYLPAGYAENSLRYPVIYLLDGEFHFHHATGIVSFLASQGRMPQAIVVGVGNTDRTRDLTPTHDERAPTSGGGAVFLSFIETELIPEIDKSYRTGPLKVLVGHSFGGLFAVNAMIERPGLFDAHIAAAPTLPWDNQLMARKLEPLLAKPVVSFLYYTLGTESADSTEGSQKFAELLTRAAPKTLRWKFDQHPADDHGSIVHRTIYDGLEMYFHEWRTPETVKTAADLVAHYDKIAHIYKMPPTPPEETVNLLGYQHLLATPPSFPAAIELFELNIELYPDSANVYDSLGEAHERSGELEKALASYEQAVERSQPGGQFHEAFIANRDRVAKALGR